MVAKINFELSCPKNKFSYINRDLIRKFKRSLLPLFLFLSLFFLFYCSVKIVADLCEISDLKAQLDDNIAMQKKLADKVSTEAVPFEAALDYKTDQLPSIEILSMLHEAIKGCNGVSVTAVSADMYGMNLKGSCVDYNQLNRFADRLGKSLLAASVGAPVIKDSETEGRTTFTLYLKLNSLRYALENDASFKQEAR